MYKQLIIHFMVYAGSSLISVLTGTGKNYSVI